MHPSPAATRHVRDLARLALAVDAERDRAALSSSLSARIAPEETLFAITRHRLVTLLAPRAEALGLPAEVASALQDLQAGQRQTLLAQQLELADVHGLVTGSGVPCLVIKGLALAVQTTDDPAARGPGDVDLLVPPASVPQVHLALARNGWRLRADGHVSPGTWAWRHVLRNTCALTYVGPGSNIDLHWRLDTTVDALPTFEELWARREQVSIAGSSLGTLGRRDALAQSSFHAAKDRWRWLRSLVDVHRLAGLDGALGDAADLHRLELMTLAVTRTAIGLPADLPDDVSARLDRLPQRRVERALRDQELPALKGSATPGVESALNFRYLLTASTSARDVKTSLAATTLPVKVVTGIESRTGWTGVPVAVWRRMIRARRRTAAWARHDEIVRTP